MPAFRGNALSNGHARVGFSRSWVLLTVPDRGRRRVSCCRCNREEDQRETTALALDEESQYAVLSGVLCTSEVCAGWRGALGCRKSARVLADRQDLLCTSRGVVCVGDAGWGKRAEARRLVAASTSRRDGALRIWSSRSQQSDVL